jgi:hypothetical protein
MPDSEKALVVSPSLHNAPTMFTPTPSAAKRLLEFLPPRSTKTKRARPISTARIVSRNGATLTLETAQQIANHESPRTTKLYDRRQDEISLDEFDALEPGPN